MKFPVEYGQRKTTFLCAGLLFAVTSAFIILKAARDALFLSAYPATALPYFMGITTVATAILASIYIRVYKKLSLDAAVELSLKLFAFGTLLLWVAFKVEWSFANPILYVWSGVFGTMVPVQCWLVISEQLLTRQAKRDFGVIGSGGILGAATGGLFASWIASISSVSSLLPTATILILSALFIVQSLSTTDFKGTPFAITDEPQMKVSSTFVVLIIIVVSMGSIVTTFADFQFKVVAQREMFTAEKLATLFGNFYAVTGFATFLFQLFVTPAIMRRIGVSAAMAFLPVGLAIGNALMLTAASLWSAITLKGAEQLLKHSVDRSSLEVLYMAIPEDVKIRLKSLIDTVGVQTAEAVGAGLLILLFSMGNVPLNAIAVISLIFLGISIACTVLLGREYPRALKNALQQKEVDFSTVNTNFFTTDLYNVLPEILQKSNKKTLLDLLQLLSSTRSKKLGAYLESMLEHPDPDIRLKVLQLLFGQQSNLSTKVENLISDPEPRIRVEAIRYLCFKSSIDPLSKLTNLLTDPDPTVQAAAFACSLNLQTTRAQEDAYRQIEKLMGDFTSSSPLKVRLEVARILRHVKPSPSAEQLFRKLLNDPDSSVQKEALLSVAEMHPSGMIPDVLALIDHHYLKQEIRSALSGFGEVIFPELIKILEKQSADIEARKLVIKVLSDVRKNPPVEVLIRCALGSNLTLRFAAIKALNHIRKRETADLPWEPLESMLDQEILALEVEFERDRYLLPKRGGLMQSVLKQRQLWARERMFRVLGLLYDPRGIHTTYKALQGNDRRRIDSALEYLDTILSQEHRGKILSLLEMTSQNRMRNPDHSVRKSVLFGYLGARDQLPAAAIIADLDSEELAAWSQELTNALNVFSGLTLVEETLHWRYSVMENKNITRKLTTIQKLEKLNSVDIFSNVGPNELLLLADHCSDEDYLADHVIFSKGDPAHEIYILIDGKVELLRSSTSFATIHPGEMFGVFSVLGEQPHLFSARTKEPSLCLKLNRDAFWDVLEEYPLICKGIFKAMAVRVSHLMN